MTRVTLILRQSAQISVRHGTDYIQRSEHHVPGWQLRGAFAAAWIRKNKEPTPGNGKRHEFEQLFERGEVRFGPAYAGDGPRSLAVYGHKYAPEQGCIPSVDRALDREGSPVCGNCGQEWVQLRGIAPDQRPTVDRRTGTQIDANGIAVDGNLFVRESIRCGTTLRADVIGENQLIEVLRGLGAIRVGGRRTAYGLTLTHWSESGGAEAAGELSADGTEVVLRLASPAIFVDGTGRPVSAPDAHELTECLGQPATVVRAWTRWSQVGGWHAASGLPKHLETVVGEGSTFLVKTEDPVTREALHGLWRRGLGLRRHEGFGHLVDAHSLGGQQ